MWSRLARFRPSVTALALTAVGSGVCGFALGRTGWPWSPRNHHFQLIQARDSHPVFAEPDLARMEAVGPVTAKPREGPADEKPSHEDPPLTRYSLANAAAKVSPAVVNITVAQVESQWGSWGPRYLSQSSGTGFIIDGSGNLLTNAHVVAQARSGGDIQVTLQDGRNFNGVVTTFDSLSDLAIVKIAASEPLPTAKLGSSSDLRAGELVVAVGSPLTLKNSITAGIISNSGRESYEIGMGGYSAAPAFIQTDAAINIGNSGGPLVNLDGEVIGITTMKVESGDGISFAIPIDYAQDVLGQIANQGLVRRPYLGVKLLTVTPVLLRELRRLGRKFPSTFDSLEVEGKDTGFGVMVHEVLPRSPADKGGLRAGDVIHEADGKPVTTTRQLIDTLTQHLTENVELKLIRGRDGASITVKVRPEILQPRPDR